MKEITTWNYDNKWHAQRAFNNNSLTFTGTGKTKEEAISSLCDAMMTLSEEMKRVVHEVNINE